VGNTQPVTLGYSSFPVSIYTKPVLLAGVLSINLFLVS